MKKTVKILSYTLSGIVLLMFCFVGVRYFNEIRTLTSLKLVEGTNLYTMEYFSDYKFDSFLKTGAGSNKEYYDYVNNIVNQSLDIGVGSTDIKDACSAFTFRDKNGKRYLARNYDNTANPVLLVVTSPKDAYKSISAVNMNCLGFNVEKEPKAFDLKLFGSPYFPTDGVNEKGVSISVLQVNFSRKQKDSSKVTIGVFAVDRLVLDYADSIDTALKLIEEYNVFFDSSLNAHFLIADSKGRSVILEFVNGETIVIENDRKYQIASNFNNTEEVFDEEGYVYPDEYREWLTGASVSAYESEYSGYVRYDYMLDSLYNSSGILNMDEAFDLLENVASPSKLQYSVIYNMSDLQATVVTDNDWEKRTTAALSGV